MEQLLQQQIGTTQIRGRNPFEESTYEGRFLMSLFSCVDSVIILNSLSEQLLRSHFRKCGHHFPCGGEWINITENRMALCLQTESEFSYFYSTCFPRMGKRAESLIAMTYAVTSSPVSSYIVAHFKKFDLTCFCGIEIVVPNGRNDRRRRDDRKSIGLKLHFKERPFGSKVGV